MAAHCEARAMNARPQSPNTTVRDRSSFLAVVPPLSFLGGGRKLPTTEDELIIFPVEINTSQVGHFLKCPNTPTMGHRSVISTDPERPEGAEEEVEKPQLPNPSSPGVPFFAPLRRVGRKPPAPNTTTPALKARAILALGCSPRHPAQPRTPSSSPSPFSP